MPETPDGPAVVTTSPTAPVPATGAAVAADPAAAAAAATAAIAARRRGKKNPAAPEAPLPGGAPAAVDGTVPETVVASRTLVSEHLGAAGPPSPTGGVFMSHMPLILEPQPASAIALDADADYVIAECDAEESMVPPGGTTPVSRSLWFKGYRIYRPFYVAVLEAHAVAVAEGRATDAMPAALPDGRAGVPDVVVVDRVTAYGLGADVRAEALARHQSAPVPIPAP